jgi:hypothetical protein
MRPDNDTLIDYLDGSLNQEEKTAVENQLKQDKSLSEQLEYLKLAVDTIHRDAINEKVSAIRGTLKTDTSSEKPSGAIVRSMYKTSFRIAAILVLFMGIAMLYKYSTISNQSVYEKQFAGYDLSNTRGIETKDAETEAYQNKNWIDVIASYRALHTTSNQSTFLAAMAAMQLSRFPEAVGLFERILSDASADRSFREETEYYLALAYLMNHEENKGVQLLSKIKADPSHTYYPLASKISSIDMKIIELKK